MSTSLCYSKINHRGVGFLMLLILLGVLYWLVLPSVHLPMHLVAFPLLVLLVVSQLLSMIDRSMLQEIANRDSLTGLYNRAYAEAHVSRLLRKNSYPIGLIYCDINSLKKVNDSQGHQVGDQQLQQVANLLRSLCRKNDIVARWGGDEFVILLPNASMADVLKVSSRISEGHVEIAVGLEVIYSKHCGFEQMLANAEQAMYRDKRRLKGL